jgi:hypothetical protein
LIKANYAIVKEVTINTANREAATHPSPMTRAHNLGIPDIINQITTGAEATDIPAGSNQRLLQAMALMMGAGFGDNRALQITCTLMAQQFPAILTEYTRDIININGVSKRNHQTTPGLSTEMHLTPQASNDKAPQIMELAALPATGEENTRREVTRNFQAAKYNNTIQMINAACLTLGVATLTARSNHPTRASMSEQGPRKIIQTIKGSTLDGGDAFCRAQEEEVNKDLRDFLTKGWQDGGPHGTYGDNRHLRSNLQEYLANGNWTWLNHPCPKCKGPWNINKHWPLAGVKAHLREGCRTNTNTNRATTAPHQETTHQTNPVHNKEHPQRPTNQHQGHNPGWGPEYRPTRGRGNNPRGFHNGLHFTTTARETYRGRGNPRGLHNRGRPKHYTPQGNHNDTNYTTASNTNTTARGRIRAHNNLNKYQDGLLPPPHY